MVGRILNAVLKKSFFELEGCLSGSLLFAIIASHLLAVNLKLYKGDGAPNRVEMELS
jgi:hypothetical protein